MILLIDNYDSFTYNLYQLLGELSMEVRVIRNDEMSVEEIRALGASGIVLSPGPGRPEDSGVCLSVLREMRGELPILGVCLGEQAMVLSYGGRVGYAKRMMHGKASTGRLLTESCLFKGISGEMQVGRYHSLAAERESLLGLPLKISMETKDGEVMAVEDSENRVYGVQFHPESILTPEGKTLLRNFIEICGEKKLRGERFRI